MKPYLFPVFAAAVLLSSITSAGAADTPKPAVSPRLEKFFKMPQFGIAVLSPDQKNLAVTTAVEGRFHLAVLDLETNKITHVAGFDDANVCSVHWINNTRMIFDLEDLDSPHDKAKCGNGLFAVNRDGSKFSELMATFRKQIDHIDMAARQGAGYDPTVSALRFVDKYPDESDDVLVEKYASHGSDDHGLYKFNTVNFHKHEFLNGLPGQPQGFITDSKQQLRLVITRSQRMGFENIWYRDTPTAPWKKILERDNLKPEFIIAGFDSDDKTLYVASRAGEDKWGIYKFDFAQNKVGEKIATDPAVDVGSVYVFDGSEYSHGVVFDGSTHKLLGVRILSEPPRTQWIDADFAKAQEEVDAAFPDRINVLSGSAKTRMLVYSYSSSNPGEYYLYDPAKKKLQFLIKTRPWIKPEEMSDQLLFDYSARDGLHIPAYLTVPKGKELKSLPLIVLVHGGPTARDDWGFNSRVQFLADLGYAVLQPQFRGSDGFGTQHMVKGWKQWGLTMQDDVTDGVNALVKQGVVDPAKVCIMGSNYGGYATLMGLAKEPHMFRCGIDLFGVADIGLLYTMGDWRDDDDAQFDMKAMIGDPDAMKEQFDATSPVKLADNFNAPVFMVYGGKDTRVPIEHGERMKKALLAKGKSVEWMELPEEEHGITKEENRYKAYGAIEAFLKKYNPVSN